MVKSGSVATLVACFLLLLAPASAQKRPITEKDLFRFQWIGDPQISRDGSQAAFVRITVDEKRTGYETSIWSVPTAGGDPRRLTSGKHDSTPRWSPDGRFLAFMRAPEKDGKPQPGQIFILPLNGGEAWQLTKIAQGASQPTWSPDGKTIAFNSSANPQDLARAACEEASDKNKSNDKDKGSDKDADKDKPAAKDDHSACGKPDHEPDIHVVTRAVYRANGQGYLDFSHADHIWTIAFPSDPQNIAPPRQLTSGLYDEEEITWAPDGSKIYYTSDRDLEPYYSLGKDILYSVPAAGGEPTEVTHIPGGFLGGLSISDDGRHMAFFGQLDLPVQSHKKTNLWMVDLTPGATPRNLTEKYDWDIGGGILGDQEPPRAGGGASPAWSSDGKSITVVVAREGRANLERFDLSTGQPTQVTTGDQSIAQFSSNGSALVAQFSTPTVLSDLLFVPGSGAPRVITSINQSLFSELNITAPEEIWYKSFDGRKIQGWIQKPPDFDPHKKYPLILNIHGGPHAAYGYVFFHEMQWMAAKGYVVLYPNPRGSTSYSEEFGNIIQYHYPGDDFRDLMTGVDELIHRGYIDEKKLGVTGGSGGGLLTNWIVTHTDRFAAAASQRDISDWAAWWYTADFTLFQPAWFHKPPFEDPNDYRDRSPITYVNNVKTPLMLILGDADLRSPAASGGEEMFRALKYRKIPTVMVRFPGETHELSRSGQPWHRIERLHHIVNWFDIYLKGEKSNEYDLVPPLEPDWEKTAN